MDGQGAAWTRYDPESDHWIRHDYLLLNTGNADGKRRTYTQRISKPVVEGAARALALDIVRAKD